MRLLSKYELWGRKPILIKWKISAFKASSSKLQIPTSDSSIKLFHHKQKENVKPFYYVRFLPHNIVDNIVLFI
jgi:hypothetical protein